jgi:hypothetical protein
MKIASNFLWRYRKLDWLSSNTIYTDQWMFENIPEYKPIVFNDEIVDLLVLKEEELTMKKVYRRQY